MNPKLTRWIFGITYFLSVCTLWYYTFAPAIAAYGFWTFVGNICLLMLINFVCLFMYGRSYTNQPQATYKENHNA